MKKLLLLVPILLTGFFSAFSQSPAITSIDPAAGLPGTVITITGTNLDSVTAVTFGGTPARSFVINSGTSISAVVGTGSSGAVEVVSPQGSASFAGFTFVVPVLTMEHVSDGAEGGQAVQFRVRYPDGYVPAEETAVTYQLSGTAVSGADYPALSGAVTIPAGVGSALITIGLTDDQVLEGPEEIRVSLVTASSGAGDVEFDPEAVVSASAGDNDTNSSLSLALQNNGAEPGTGILFRIAFPAGVTSSVPTTVTYQVSGSATSGSDYAALSGTLVLPAGENSAELPVSVTDDNVFEGPETVSVLLLDATNTVAAVTVPAESAEGVISDDEEDPARQVLTLTRVSDGAESGGDIVFSVSFPSGVSRGDATTVTYTIGGTATPGTDHTGSDGTLVIPAGSGSGEIRIVVTDDRVIEPVETVTVTLTGAMSGSVELRMDPAGPVSAELTDNDHTATNTRITVGAVTPAAEPGTNGRFQVRFPEGISSSAATTVTYDVAGTAAAGTDYTALSGTVTIPAGANAVNVDLQVQDDDTFEGDEAVELTLLSATSDIAALTVDPAPASVTIADNDENPADNVLSLSLAGPGAEGGATVRFRISYPSGIVKTFQTTVSYEVSGTATAGSDYTAPSGTLVIPAEQNSAEVTIPVTDDRVIEPAETLILKLSSAAVPAGVTSVVTVDPDPVSAQLTDNDNIPANNVISVAAVMNAAEPATNGRFQLRFPEGISSSAATTVTYAMGGTATAGTDYTVLSGTITIPAGANAVSVDVAVQDDETFEGDETVQLTLLSATSDIAALTVDPAPVSLTIAENDENPADNVLTLSRAGPGAEGGATVRFRISYPSGIVKTFQTTVSYEVSGTATAGSDYTAPSGTLVIPAGQNSAEVAIPVTDDRVIEPAETLIMTLSSAAVPAGVTSVVTVDPDPVSAGLTDNDNIPANNVISVAAVANGAEPATNGRFQVRFPEGISSSAATTVTYAMGGTATAGADYTALSGTITIPAGANAVNLDVAVQDDRIMEGTEDIRISLRGATSGISALTVSGTVPILNLADDDHGAAVNTVTLTRVRDGGEPGNSAGFRVSFPENVTSTSNTTVSFTIGGTAVNGTDYTGMPHTVIIPAGQNGASIDLSVSDDQVLEGEETVILALTSAVAADTLLAVATGTVSVSIADNDLTARNQVLTLVKESDAAEPGTDAVFMVRYPEGIVSAAATTVSYGIAGTATNGADYARLSGSLEIPAGSNGAEIRVVVTDDQEIEITETVALTLRSAASPVSPALTVGTTASVIANLADNDSSAPNTITLVRVQDGAEPAWNPLFRVSFSPGISSSAVTIVSYSVGGSAGNGTDYRSLSGSVIIPAGSNSADIPVTVLDDHVVDPDETVELTLTSVTNSLTSLSLFPATPVAAVIRDDDIPSITSFSPATGPAGTAVTISGSRFDPLPERNIVFFGAVRATVTAAAPDRLTVTAPAAATHEPLTVTVQGLTAGSATPFGITFPNDAGIDPRGFSAGFDPAPGRTASALATGDLNGDGRIDILATGDRSLTILRNTGAGETFGPGSFSGAGEFPLSGDPFGALVRDLDGDGRPDVIVSARITGVADTTARLYVFRNTGSADTLRLEEAADLPVPGRSPRLAVADMDGDGRPDLVTAGDEPLVRVFRNTGSLVFEPSGAYAAGAVPADLAATDLNGDRRADIVLSDPLSGSLLVLVNTGTGGTAGFAAPVTIPAGGTPSEITAADLNRDGLPDLAVVTAEGMPAVSLNTGTDGQIGFAQPEALPGGETPGPVTAGDLDGDGRVDLLVVPGNASPVAVYRNTGSGTRAAFTGPVTIPAANAGAPVRVADLDGDSKPELLMIDPGERTLRVLRNSLDQPVLAAVSPAIACAGSTVTLTGSNLQGATAVSFGDVAAASFTVVSSTTITAVVPPGAGGEVSVTTPKGIVSRAGFSPVPVPVISADGSTTFATGGQVVLSVSTDPAYSYVWQKDGADLEGATGTTFTARETGSYRVRILEGSCGAVSEPVAVTAVFTLPAANFSVSATAESCRSSDNGEIVINAALALDYTATLTGSGRNLSARFTRDVRFSELTAGTYRVCLAVDGQPDYRLCYDVVVSEPEDLAVYSTVNPADNSLDLVLSGSDLYYVELNGVTQAVKENRITLPLKPGANRLKVSTGRDCQGMVERVILGGMLASVFPNPFENVLHVALPENGASSARIRITNAGGHVVYTGRFVNSYGNIRLDLPDLGAGVYFLKLSMEGAESVYKIIRK